MSVNTDILKTLIANQKDAIRYQVVFAFLVIVLGFCLIGFSNFLTTEAVSTDSIKLILKMGGGFISTVSAYPINQIITRKEKIKTYETLRVNINDMNESELKRVEDLIWKSLEKIT